jgi:hypothetical protein
MSPSLRTIVAQETRRIRRKRQRKTFITPGCGRISTTVAVRTGGGGRIGVSLLRLSAEREGFTRTA